MVPFTRALRLREEKTFTQGLSHRKRWKKNSVSNPLAPGWAISKSHSLSTPETNLQLQPHCHFGDDSSMKPQPSWVLPSPRQPSGDAPNRMSQNKLLCYFL